MQKGEALPEKNESSDEDAHDTACRSFIER